MLKGEVFSLQTFSNGAFAIIIDKVLNGNCGVEVGCELSYTTNSATIGEGHFVVRGRPLQIISSETVSDINADGFYSLVCEIDLSKQNTKENFNQAAIKTVYSASNYPTLTQQDITNKGIVYQYEFARFKVESGNITNFTDRRTYINLASVIESASAEFRETLKELQKELAEVEDGSAYVLKTEVATMINKKYASGDTPPNSDLDVDIYDQYF